MDLTLTTEQTDLAKTIGSLLDTRFPASALSSPEEPQAATRLWSELADGGWLGVGAPEDLGGAGGGAIELGIIFRELGRTVAPSRYRSAVLTRLLIQALARPDQTATLLPELCTGQRTSTVAFAEVGVENDPALLSTVAAADGAGWLLSGAKVFVPDAGSADLLIIAAQLADTGSLAFFAIERQAPGLTVAPRRTFSRDPHFDIALREVSVDGPALIGDEDSSARYLDYRELVTALTSMEMVGALERVSEIMITNVTNRSQFGVPVGSFQAVQHHVANVAIALAGARLAAWKAVVTGRSGAAAIAKAAAGRALRDATVIAHQISGGMGYTTESPLHRYSERAMAQEIFLGGWEYQLDRLAAEIGLPGERP